MKQGTAKFLLFFQLERGGPSFAVLNVKKKKRKKGKKQQTGGG